jgi:hypothetical protein
MTKEELNGQVDVWIKELKMQELADGTLRNYRPIVQRFIDWIPEDCEISKELVMDFKEYLESIGDSIVVVADDEIVKVHVHTNHPGQAFEKGLEYGQHYSVKDLNELKAIL